MNRHRYDDDIRLRSVGLEWCGCHFRHLLRILYKQEQAIGSGVLSRANDGSPWDRLHRFTCDTGQRNFGRSQIALHGGDNVVPIRQ